MPSLDIPLHPKARFQRLVPADSQQLSELHTQCFAGRAAWSPAEFSSLLAQGSCIGFSLIEGGTLLAFALYQGVAPETELLTMCTDPNHRRQNLAKTLLQNAENELGLAGIERIWLDVSESNTAARNLYESLGFVGISERKGYYATAGGSHTALVMAKDIAGQKGPEGPFSGHGPS